MLNNKPIGQIRFDFDSNKYLIDYSIDKDLRGNGYRYLIVKERIDSIKKDSQTQLFEAWVKPDNIASIKAFTDIGFTELQEVNHNGTNLIKFEFSL